MQRDTYGVKPFRGKRDSTFADISTATLRAVWSACRNHSNSRIRGVAHRAYIEMWVREELNRLGVDSYGCVD